MRLAATLLLAALTCGCLSRPPSSPQELESALQENAETVIHLDALTLYSPYGAAATDEYSSVLGEEFDLVRALFADAGAPPIRFYLVPLPEGAESADLQAWEAPGINGIGGAAFHEGFACAYVRGSAAPSEVRMQAVMSTRTLRHELAHVVARRAGLDRAAWFNEGLAREVEHMGVGVVGLVPHPFPEALVGARQSAHGGAVRNLLDWKLTDGSTIEERARRYDEAEALFRFLSQRQAEGSWIERAHGVMGLGADDIVALEPDWLEWLARQDALAAIRAGTRSSDAAERAQSARWLPVLAERGAAELSTRSADELALDLLADPITCEPAATFLIFFRARALTEADLVDLCRSADPARCLTGLALRKKRGEPVDAEQVRDAWRRVPESDRHSLELQRIVLDIADAAR